MEIKIKNPKIFYKIIDRIMDNIIDEIFYLSQVNIKRNNSIDEGTLLKTGYVNRRFLDKQIIYPVLYADYIEYGTRPHMPPVDALIGWVRRKLRVDESKARSIAWSIAKHIKKYGTEPKPYLRPAMYQVQHNYKQHKV